MHPMNGGTHAGNNHHGMNNGLPMITVHTGKCYKALINSVATISLL